MPPCGARRPGSQRCPRVCFAGEGGGRGAGPSGPRRTRNERGRTAGLLPTEGGGVPERGPPGRYGTPPGQTGAAGAARAGHTEGHRRPVGGGPLPPRPPRGGAADAKRPPGGVSPRRQWGGVAAKAAGGSPPEKLEKPAKTEGKRGLFSQKERPGSHLVAIGRRGAKENSRIPCAARDSGVWSGSHLVATPIVRNHSHLDHTSGQ